MGIDIKVGGAYVPHQASVKVGGVYVPHGVSFKAAGAYVSAGGSGTYLGPVASRTLMPNTYSTGVKQIMCASVHTAGEDDLTSLQLLLPNWYVTSTGVESLPGASTDVNASIEYPIGSAPVAVTFSGSADGVMGDGETVLSDPVSVAIPANARFRVRIFLENATGLMYADLTRNTTAGEEFMQYGVSGVTDKTLTGTLTNTSGSATTLYAPLAILGQTARRTVLFVGDSKLYGTADTYTGNETIKGAFGRAAIAAGYASINAARASVRAEHFVASASRQLALAQYVTDVVCQYGMNDLIASRPAATIQASMAAMWTKFPGLRVYQSTITPRTDAGNTSALSEAVRDPVNAWIAGVPAGLTGVVDVNAVLESSDLWASSTYTADGVHELRPGNVAVADSGLLAAALAL
jgi:hypothetical protein